VAPSIRLFFAHEGSSESVVIDGPLLETGLVEEDVFEPVAMRPPEEVVPRHTLGRDAQVYRVDAADEWRVPSGAVDWLVVWGELDFLPTLDVEPVPALGVDPAGERPRGLRIRGRPGEGTPLRGSLGLRRGDVLLAVDGRTCRVAQELLSAFRERAGARLVLRVERAGIEIDLAYQLARVGAAAGLRPRRP
jgi:hypothetical protein